MSAKETRVRVARETVDACERGWYVAPSGRHVDIAESLRQAVEGTVEYAADADLPSPVTTGGLPEVRVVDASTFPAARGLDRQVVLNFASARNPGGGFLGGAQAQEETLARTSGLHACLTGRQMYAVNRAGRDLLYSHAMVYSPGVPVLREDDGTWLEQPWPCAVVTAPAPNAGEVLRRDPGRTPEVEAALAERARRVLAVASAHGHRAVVLGAWGCGVFRNDPHMVATAFAALLRGPFAGAFDTVVFAILGAGQGARQRQVFSEVLGSPP